MRRGLIRSNKYDLMTYDIPDGVGVMELWLGLHRLLHQPCLRRDEGHGVFCQVGCPCLTDSVHSVCILQSCPWRDEGHEVFLSGRLSLSNPFCPFCLYVKVTAHISCQGCLLLWLTQQRTINSEWLITAYRDGLSLCFIPSISLYISLYLSPALTTPNTVRYILNDW